MQISEGGVAKEKMLRKSCCRKRRLNQGWNRHFKFTWNGGICGIGWVQKGNVSAVYKARKAEKGAVFAADTRSQFIAPNASFAYDPFIQNFSYIFCFIVTNVK